MVPWCPLKRKSCLDRSRLGVATSCPFLGGDYFKPVTETIFEMSCWYEDAPEGVMQTGEEKPFLILDRVL